MNLIRVFLCSRPCLECQYRLGWEQRECLVATMHRQYALSVRKDTSAAQSNQDFKVKLDCQGNSSIDSCDETFTLTQQVSYVSMFSFGYRCQFILEPLSQITFRVSQTQRLHLIFGLISCLGLKTISSVQWEWAIQVPCGRVVVLFTLTIEIHPLMSWLDFFV